MKKKICFIMFFCIIILCILGYKYVLIDHGKGLQTISDYMVELQEIVEGNMEGHAILSGSLDNSPIRVPELVYDSLQNSQIGLFHFDQLTDAEKRVYAEILWAVTAYVSDVQVSTLNNETVSKCFQCVLNDHPEIFYVDGYRYTNYYIGGELSKIGISGTYTMSRENAKKYRNRVDACVNQIMEEIPASDDEYEKTKFLYEYLITQTEYDADVENNQNILSVFLDKRSVCQGYTKAMQYLLKRAGIKSTTVLGHVKGGNHAWNLVFVNGNWYYLDATWGDSAYYRSISADACAASIGEVNYDYLLVTSSFLEMTHIIDNVIAPPPCISVKDNYYVREGLYFENIDTESIKSVFDRSYAAGQGLVTLKCASPVVYEQMKSYLINEQEVFNYLHSDNGKIAYIDNTAHNSISFWL